ncbi:MAG: ABC transporter ATP-binding protein [Myxococcaceae bacterium]|nr:ABC transporter ATP-binding protein [Myxococcaceae bacterium]MCI0669200.1 ABC transporter ATP-binding protein [Myxococcaceae bacterium]
MSGAAASRTPSMPPGAPLLEVEGLSVSFATAGGRLRAVDGVSFSLTQGRRVGLVGESGSGKSVTAQALMGLLDAPGVQVEGELRLGGERLTATDERRWRTLRGNKVAMVFQDPAAALNPRMRVGEQVTEGLLVHQGLGRAERRRRAVELLTRVGLPDAGVRVDAWPHELSGGMRQRVCIAMALACGPQLLIADEPTTALDVTVQAQVMALLARLQAETGMAVLLISHDLGLVAEWCDEVMVMYAGQLVERGPAARVLTRPRHPYTAGLLASLPLPGERRERLVEIPGMVPDMRAPPSGCRFNPRCPRADERCRAEAPAWSEEAEGGHRCHLPLSEGT